MEKKDEKEEEEGEEETKDEEEVCKGGHFSRQAIKKSFQYIEWIEGHPHKSIVIGSGSIIKASESFSYHNIH